MARTQVVDFLLAGFTDSSGSPLSLGKVYTKEAGTNTDKTTWSTVDKVSSHANPIILDSNGRKQVYADGAYKFLVHDSNDNLLYTLDNLFYGESDGVTFDGGTSSGAANIYNITLAPAIMAYATGMLFTFTAHQTNTGAAVVAVNGLAQKSFSHALSASIPLIGGEIVTGQAYLCRYDGTVVRILSPSTNCIDKRTATSGAGISSTAENTLYSYTIPANVLAPYKAARITIYGDVKNTTGGNVVYTWRAKLGGTTFFEVGSVTIATGVDRGTFRMECYIHSLGASAQKTSGHLALNDTTSNNVSGSQQDLSYTAQYDGLTKDTTTALEFLMSAQMDTNSANAEIRVKSSMIEVL